MRRHVIIALAVVAGVGAAVAPTGAGAESGFDRVVTLGDSYSSGQGVHADASDYDDHGPPRHKFDGSSLGGSACHRDFETTPGPRLAQDFGAESVFIACAGAEVRHIPNQLASAAIPGDGSGTLVSITIGGNDLRTRGGEDWPTVLLDCIVSFGCDHGGSNQPINLVALESDLTALYTRVGLEYPEITVRALGYPRLMQRERWGCPGVTGVGRGEADWIDRQVDSLNDAIAGAARVAGRVTGADIRYVSVVDEFDNRGSCRFWQRDRYVNDHVSGEILSRRMADDGTVFDKFTDTLVTVSGSSFHPSRKGYEAYYRVLADSLD
ncbi:MAG: GDSL-type esterase/lipase family protein [Ilumatobacteraceae bacterium]